MRKQASRLGSFALEIYFSLNICLSLIKWPMPKVWKSWGSDNSCDFLLFCLTRTTQHKAESQLVPPSISITGCKISICNWPQREAFHSISQCTWDRALFEETSGCFPFYSLKRKSESHPLNGNAVKHQLALKPPGTFGSQPLPSVVALGSGTHLGLHLGEVSKASKQPGVEWVRRSWWVSSLRCPAKVNNP